MKENGKESMEIRRAIGDIVGSEPFGEEQSSQNLSEIHRQIQKRSVSMKVSYKKILIVAAAMVTLGTVTAVAAGQIKFFQSSTNREDAIGTAADLRKKSEGEMGTSVRIPEQFADGRAFTEGYITRVDAMDGENNKVSDFPNAMASYGDGEELFLNIEKPLGNMPEDSRTAAKQADYKGLKIQAYEDAYLFLPPDAKPSEADTALEKEGKLYISYGSSQEERKTYRTVSWTEDGLDYAISTFNTEGKNSLDELIGLAKEVIDTEK